MSTISREETGVSVNTSDLSEVHVHVTTSDAHILPFAGGMRLYFDVASDEMLDNLIEALIEARAVVTAAYNARWTEAVKADANSELTGNPKEEAA